MSSFLLENLTEVAARLAETKQVLLFLDYDGTLTPIVERPDGAHIAPEIREIVQSLGRIEKVVPAIVSGRAIGDVESRVGIPGLIYAGNHGLEIAGRGFSFVLPAAGALRGALQQLAETLAGCLSHIEGVEVENKGLTLSVHFRRAAPTAAQEVLAVVRAATSERHEDFVVRAGKKIYEIRPNADWHKGSAVRWISERVQTGGALPIYVGDDVTDEDAFAALPEGITIKVGESAATAATYYLRGPGEVAEFLMWLQRVVEDEESG